MKNLYLRLAFTLSLLLATLAGVAPASAANSAKGVSAQPDTVTAADLMTKVYAILPADVSGEEMIADANARALSPKEDETGLWLDSDSDSYSLCYAGITPDVSARAEYTGGELDNFGYFFLFPYSCEVTKAAANSRQCQFCGCLLQEMNDMGMDMGADPATDNIFDAVGMYAGNLVEVSLIDDGNRYIVVLTVEPRAFTAADGLTASLD